MNYPNGWGMILLQTQDVKIMAFVKDSHTKKESRVSIVPGSPMTIKEKNSEKHHFF